MISDSAESILKPLYERCCSAGKIKPGSFLIKGLSSNKNTIYSIVTKKTLKAPVVNQDVQELLNNGYIREFQPPEYTITAKGIWYIETKYYSMTTNQILEFFDKRFLEEEDIELVDSNRVILLGTICAHAFSSDCELSPTGLNSNHFLSLMRDSFDLLKSLELVSAPSFDALIESKNSQKVKSGTLTNKIDKLPRLTRSAFRTKSGSYYLDIIEDGHIKKNDLKLVLKIIFEKISIDNLDGIIESIRTISLDYSYIYAINSQIPEQDACAAIEDCIEELAGF